MRDGINRQIRGGLDANVSDFGDRVTVHNHFINSKLADPTNFTAQFVVVNEFDDYLQCVPFIPPNDGFGASPGSVGASWIPQVFPCLEGITPPTSNIVVFVAKPFMLQQTPWVKLFSFPTSGVRKALTNFSFGFSNRLQVVPPSNPNPWDVFEQQAITPAYTAGEIILAKRTVTGYTDPITKQPILWMDANAAARLWLRSNPTPFCLLSLQVTSPNSDGTYTCYIDKFQSVGGFTHTNFFDPIKFVVGSEFSGGDYILYPTPDGCLYRMDINVTFGLLAVGTGITTAGLLLNPISFGVSDVVANTQVTGGLVGYDDAGTPKQTLAVPIMGGNDVIRISASCVRQATFSGAGGTGPGFKVTPFAYSKMQFALPPTSPYYAYSNLNSLVLTITRLESPGFP